MEIKISVNLLPPVRCYQMYAYPLSIIFKTDKAVPWFISNFINIKSCIHRLEDYEYMDLRYVYPRYELCDFYDYYKMNQSVYKKGFVQDIHTLIRSVLNEGYCISFFVDEYYVPNRMRYKKEHKRHLIMVCGYNDQKNTYDIIGYDINHYISRTSVDSYKLEEAFYNYEIIDKDMDNITIMGLKNHSGSSELNKNLLVKNLKEYLECTNTDDPDVAEYYYRKPVCFGLDIYKDIKYYLSKDDYQLNNYPMFYMIYEYKKNFIFRMEYLQKYMDLDLKKIIVGYSKVEENAYHLLQSFLKYYVCKDNNRKKMLSKRLITSIDQMCEQEQKYLSMLLESLMNT